MANQSVVHTGGFGMLPNVPNGRRCCQIVTGCKTNPNIFNVSHLLRDDATLGCHWFPIDRQRVPIIRELVFDNGHCTKG